MISDLGCVTFLYSLQKHNMTNQLLAAVGWPEILGFLLIVPFFIFWVWMLVDCAKYEKEGSTKIVWILVILLAGCWIGAPIYYFARKLPRKSVQ